MINNVAFLPVQKKSHANKLYIKKQCMYILWWDFDGLLCTIFFIY